MSDSSQLATTDDAVPATAEGAVLAADAAPAWLQVAVDAAAELKALDLRLLDLRGRCDFADFFLICSGRSNRQVQAIADRVERRLREHGQKALHTEGERQGQWVLIDYADLVVHVFDPQTRDFYRLDRLWNDAPVITSWDGEQPGGEAPSETQ